MSEMENGFGRYLFEYRHQGSVWGFEIQATSLDDAMVRLRALPFSTYQGEISHSIDAVCQHEETTR